uniref:Growth hormone-regulated TBC protein 1-A (Trinotate prediction) n=1 Tax=Henneguya salminicola TaxID=69463 RepID=A0A6G3MJ36_HENSL
MICLNLGSTHKLRGLYTNNFPLLKYFNSVLLSQLRYRIPILVRHFDKIGYDITITTTKWFLCLFVQSLPFQLVARLWDVIIFEGSYLIICIAIALIAYHKSIQIFLLSQNIS